MLWRKSFREALLPMLSSATLLLVFAWVFVALQSTVDAGPMIALLPEFLSKTIEKLTGLPLAVLATKFGQYSLLYIDGTVLFTCMAWSIVRGSSVVSGEIGRGTMEMLLALPVRRSAVYLIPSIVSTIGTAVVAGGIIVGTYLGLVSAGLLDKIAWYKFVPGAVNLFFFMYCLTGAVTFFSSFDRERWRTIGLGVGFFATSLLLKIVSKLWAPGAALLYGSFLVFHEPHKMILATPEEFWALMLFYNGSLFAIGTAFYAAGLLVFVKRDLPAPL